MNELQLINNLGVATSSEIADMMDKSQRAIIRNLNNLELIGEIKIVIFSASKIRRRVYCGKEIYNYLNKIKES